MKVNFGTRSRLRFRYEYTFTTFGWTLFSTLLSVVLASSPPDSSPGATSLATEATSPAITGSSYKPRVGSSTRSKVTSSTVRAEKQYLDPFGVPQAGGGASGTAWKETGERHQQSKHARPTGSLKRDGGLRRWGARKGKSDSDFQAAKAADKQITNGSEDLARASSKGSAPSGMWDRASDTFHSLLPSTGSILVVLASTVCLISMLLYVLLKPRKRNRSKRRKNPHRQHTYPDKALADNEDDFSVAGTLPNTALNSDETSEESESPSRSPASDVSSSITAPSSPSRY